MAKERGITLSKVGGINATMAICFWCGETRGEIALLGNNYKENGKPAKAPMGMVLDYDPCEKCQKGFETGCTLIEVLPKHSTQPPMIASGGIEVYPTGRWIVVTQDWVKEALGIETPKAFISPELMSKIMEATQGERND